MIKKEQIKLLKCLICGGDNFDIREDSSNDNILEKGSLLCNNCKTIYHIHEKILNMLPKDIEYNPQKMDFKTKNPEWKLWCNKLNRFVDWRKSARKNDGEYKLYLVKMKNVMIDFCNFCDIKGRILDIGCSSGGIKNYMDNNIEYIGIDPLPTGTYDFLYIQAVGEAIPFNDNFFDYIVINETLDHCNKLNDLLSECNRVLKPEGRLGILNHPEPNHSKAEYKRNIFQKFQTFLGLLIRFDFYKLNEKFKEYVFGDTHLHYVSNDTIDDENPYFTIEKKQKYNYENIKKIFFCLKPRK